MNFKLFKDQDEIHPPTGLIIDSFQDFQGPSVVVPAQEVVEEVIQIKEGSERNNSPTNLNEDQLQSQIACQHLEVSTDLDKGEQFP